MIDLPQDAFDFLEGLHAQVAELRRAHGLPHAQIAVVPGEDHGHPSGRPDLFAAMVLAFLAAC